MKLEMFHETVLKCFMKRFSLISIFFSMLENIHFVSSFSQWQNGRRSRDAMIMHELSACKQDSVHAWRRVANARPSERYTEELLELYHKEDCKQNVRRDGQSIIENKAALV
jgi:hypothetical protein